MIWAENVPTIVMLTHLTEGNKIKCHQYWPKNNGETINYDGLLVTLIETDSFPDHVIRKFSVTLNVETRRVIQYHFTAWPDHGVPKFATGLLGFIRRINREYPQNKGPMMVHCSAGVGRTGTFIVIDTMMEKLEDQQPIDIYSCVTSLRTKRQEMVQSEVQYTFIHDAVLEALVCGNTEIPIQSLRIALSKLSKPDLRTKKRPYDRHFDILETTGQKLEKRLCKAGLQTGAAGKNRYKTIVPLDTQRVILHMGQETEPDSTYMNTEAGSDYINASYLDGYHRRDAFITTQGPLTETVNDFWKMIWQMKSLSIVMLTSLEEDGEEMCCQYWPSSGSSQYGQYTVSLQGKSNGGEYVKRTFTVSDGVETRTVGQFHYTQWPDKGTPKTTSQLLDMMEQLQRWQQSTGNTLITVHCNNGVGRSGVFCVLLSLIEQVKVENAVDVFLKLRSMRIQNPLLVQSVSQYKLIYDALLAYTDGFSTYANFA
jgi:protein tyrosine phosphatase